MAQDSASNVAVLISPALFMPVSVAIQAGVQFRLSNRYSLLVEGALPTFYPTNEYEKITYWRGAAELKFYTRRAKTSGGYYALQAAYLFRQLVNNTDGIVHYKDGEYHYNAATITSPVLSVALVMGRELSSKNHKLFADVFGGAGIRHLFNNYSAQDLRITSLTRSKDSFDWLFPDDGWRFGYGVTRLHLTAGLKFGLRL